MPCETAIELIRGLKRDTWIPAYDDASVRQVQKEVKELYEDIVLTYKKIPENPAERSPEDLLQLYAQHNCIERNKQCAIAYLKYRAEQILKLRWESGACEIPAYLQDRLHQNEIALAQQYDSILTSYMTSLGHNLTLDLEPPNATMITVRVLEDYGEFVTMDGTVNLTRNSTHHLRRAEVQHLIRQGILKHVH